MDSSRWRPYLNPRIQALEVYISVIAKKQLHHVSDVMGYQILILEASNEYRNDCWLGYNQCFWQQAVSQSNSKWSDIDSTLWNMAFTGQARTGWCSYCFRLFLTSTDYELASDRGMNVEPQYLRVDHLTLCHTHIGWSTVSGMRSVLQTVSSQIVIMSIFVPCAYSILRLLMFITKQLIVLTISTKAEVGHLLQAHHNLHHYSPKATSPNHHFWAHPDDTKHAAHTLSILLQLPTQALSPHTHI